MAQDGITLEEVEKIRRDREAEWRSNNRDHLVEYYAKWYSKNGRKRSPDKTYRSKWRNKNKHKISAHEAIRYALRTQKLIKPNNCELCLRDTKLQGHHRDYAKKLQVQWLCGSCHKLLH